MPKKILVADDDPAILDALAAILEDEGYDVETTADGRAVRSLEGDLPDALLLDIWMSGINGTDVCRHLKSRQQTKDLPIILISASRDTARLAEEAGADGFVEKPFDMDHLLDVIEKHTAAKRI